MRRQRTFARPGYHADQNAWVTGKLELIPLTTMRTGHLVNSWKYCAQKWSENVDAATEERAIAMRESDYSEETFDQYNRRWQHAVDYMIAIVAMESEMRRRGYLVPDLSRYVRGEIKVDWLHRDPDFRPSDTHFAPMLSTSADADSITGNEPSLQLKRYQKSEDD